MQGVWTSKNVGGLWGSGGLGSGGVLLRTHLYVQITTAAPPGGNDFRYIAIIMNVYHHIPLTSPTYDILLENIN